MIGLRSSAGNHQNNVGGSKTPGKSRQRMPYVWLSAGAITAGLSAAAIAGAGTACADDAGSASTPTHSNKSVTAHAAARQQVGKKSTATVRPAARQQVSKEPTATRAQREAALVESAGTSPDPTTTTQASLSASAADPTGTTPNTVHASVALSPRADSAAQLTSAATPTASTITAIKTPTAAARFNPFAAIVRAITNFLSQFITKPVTAPSIAGTWTITGATMDALNGAGPKPVDPAVAAGTITFTKTGSGYTATQTFQAYGQTYTTPLATLTATKADTYTGKASAQQNQVAVQHLQEVFTVANAAAGYTDFVVSNFANTGTSTVTVSADGQTMTYTQHVRISFTLTYFFNGAAKTENRGEEEIYVYTTTKSTV